MYVLTCVSVFKAVQLVVSQPKDKLITAVSKRRAQHIILSYGRSSTDQQVSNSPADDISDHEVSSL